MDPISKAFVARLEEFGGRQIPVVPFSKGQSKDDVAREQRRSSRATKGWCSSAKLRRRRRCFEPSGDEMKTGGPYPWLVRSTAMVNQFYFYCVDATSDPSS